MDNNTLADQPKASREAKGKYTAPLELGKLNDPGGAHARSRGASFRQKSRSENVQHYPESHTYMTPVGHYGPPPSMLAMDNIASALPTFPSGPTRFDQEAMQQPQFIPAQPNPGVVYGMHQFQPFPTPPTNPNMIYNTPYPQLYIPYLQQQQQHQETRLPDASVFPPHAAGSPGCLGGPTPDQMNAYGQPHFDPNMYTTTQGHRSRPPNMPSVCSQPHSQSHANTPKKAQEKCGKEYEKQITIVDGSAHMRSAAAQGSSSDSSSRPSKSTTPKGPPRKPKQSGNALWVGNLALGTNIVELKDYFSQDATKDLESVFLISRSNCAFVNYKTEEACLRALSRFHDTRLRGTRLVCRVRRGLMSPGPHSEMTGLQDASSVKEAEEMVKTNPIEDEGREGSYSTRVPNRYFILKSLTVEDLEISWQSSIWATQTHNEDSLNRAFENADNVYLIFSANKSGEYYGYARMMSMITDDDSLTPEIPPRPEHHSSTEPDSPNVIPTPASSSAPNGRIINDIARGTTFWEADTSEDEEDNSRPQKSAYQAPENQQQQPAAELQLIGKPFRIRWLSSEKVPFHRTRGLRNPWNANREVKIARDGTELEFSVGEKLVPLFHPETLG